MSTLHQEGRASSPPGTPAPDPSPKQRAILPPLKKEDFDRAGKLGSNFSIALEALWANRLRSLLTMLGIFIGVAAVVMALILTQGTSASITNSLTSLGTNVITIAPGAATTREGVNAAAGTTLSLTPADATAVSKLAHVTAVSPIISVNQQVVFSSQNWNTRVQGVSPSLQAIQTWTIAQGAWFSESDEQGARSVAVVGQTVKQNLFDPLGVDPVGQTIRINNQLYRVVGVLQSKGSGGFGGNQDDIIFVPFTAAQARLKNSGYIDQIVVQVDAAANTNEVEQEITTLLEHLHRIQKGTPDDFNLTSSQQLLQTSNQIITILTILLVGVASISLTVGGIGIMNIMIVSVTERTREIGIRMSLGAQRQDIRNQFLIEALCLSLLGGIIGMLAGFLLGFGITSLMTLPFVITVTSLLLPFAVSASIGVIFGLYPALRAARLDPIEALRSL